MNHQPKLPICIKDRQNEVTGYLEGDFQRDVFGFLTGRFSAKAEGGMVVLTDEAQHEISRSPTIRFTAQRGSNLRLRQETKPRAGATFTLFNVTTGKRFHWERTEDQTFQGDLILCPREDETITAINEISLEDYLASVISSEMSASAPIEFLKAHAMLSRSWLLAAHDRRRKTGKTPQPAGKILENGKEMIRWYDREDHDLFDVCADDHCQRYQGITKIVSGQAEIAIRETHGRGTTYQDEICDARYSTACGGLTEQFETAWDDRQVPYLTSISDASVSYRPVQTEGEASHWILS